MRSRFVLTASISALLAGVSLTACSSGSTAGPPKTDSASATGCRTPDLKWTLTLHTGAGTTAQEPEYAELTAVNPGAYICTLTGYPKR